MFDNQLFVYKKKQYAHEMNNRVIKGQKVMEIGQKRKKIGYLTK